MQSCTNLNTGSGSMCRRYGGTLSDPGDFFLDARARARSSWKVGGGVTQACFQGYDIQGMGGPGCVPL